MQSGFACIPPLACVVSAEKLPGDFYIESADFQNTNRGPQTPWTEPAEYLEVHLNSHEGSAEAVVLDSTDHALPGAVVVAIPDRRPIDLIDQSRTTTTDQHGRFVLQGLANSRYDIYAFQAVPDGAYYDPDFLADYAGTALGINNGSEHHYQVKLHAVSAAEA